MVGDFAGGVESLATEWGRESTLAVEIGEREGRCWGKWKFNEISCGIFGLLWGGNNLGGSLDWSWRFYFFLLVVAVRVLEFGIVNFGKVFFMLPPRLFHFLDLLKCPFFPFVIDDDDGFAISVVSAVVVAFVVVDDDNDDFAVAVVVSVVLLALDDDDGFAVVAVIILVAVGMFSSIKSNSVKGSDRPLSHLANPLAPRPALSILGSRIAFQSPTRTVRFEASRNDPNRRKKRRLSAAILGA